jgi:DNA (cytosine-5)-methyltransferase 1
VFVVGCLGNWESAAKVLFESESLPGNTKQSRKKREEIAKCITTRIRNDYETEQFVYENHGTDSRVKEIAISPTVTARWGTGGNNVPLAQSYCLQGAGATSQNANGSGWNEEKSFTLNVTDVHGVATPSSEISGTLRANRGSGWRSNGTPVEAVAIQNMAVRRLTEVECERLQGFPDNYTNIKENCPSGARYKALGNSMAVPVMKWIGERINDL